MPEPQTFQTPQAQAAAGAGAKPGFKRRIIVIKRALQFKYIGIVILGMMLAALVVGFDVYFTMANELTALNDPEVLAAWTRINRLMVFKLIFLVVVIGVISLFMSHKFAGPVFRLERSAQIVSDGDLTHRVFLRAGDELTELRDAFNTMVESIHQQVKKDREASQEIRRKLEEISTRLNTGGLGPQETQALARELALLKEKAGQITAPFKV